MSRVLELQKLDKTDPKGGVFFSTMSIAGCYIITSIASSVSSFVC